MSDDEPLAFRIQYIGDPEEMGDWMFTFGPVHEHPVTGVLLGGYYVKIHDTWRGARRKMLAMFGIKWSHQERGERIAEYEAAYGCRELPRELWPPEKDRDPSVVEDWYPPPEVTDTEVRQARRLAELAQRRGSDYLWIRSIRRQGVDGEKTPLVVYLLPWSFGGVQLAIAHHHNTVNFENTWYFDAEHSDDGWRAALGWDGEGEPEGWTRHPGTGRRRPDGTKASEHVHW